MTDPPGQQPDGGWVDFKDGEPAGAGQRDYVPRLVVALLALVAAVIFVAQNSTHVETKFLFFDFTARLWVVILVSILLGAGLGQAVGLLRRRRRKA
jgi:uncharacterized integral membrane protein